MPSVVGQPVELVLNLKGESLLNLALMRLIDEQFLMIATEY